MPLEWLFERFRRHSEAEALVWRGRGYTYADLLERTEAARRFLDDRAPGPGRVVLLRADYSPAAIGVLLAAMQRRDVLAPVVPGSEGGGGGAYAGIAQAEVEVRVSPDEALEAKEIGPPPSHPLLRELLRQSEPGLLLFSSGSTGEPKAALHNLSRLLQKFSAERHTQRIIVFLLFDHIGGFNSMMYALSNHGCVITLDARDPASVCAAIAKHRAEVLPASPTFLNLLLMSGEYAKHDLSSLKVINYATEVMPESTLRRLNEAFPGVQISQSYGLTELGILRSKSRGSDSLWVRVGGEGYQTRIVDGILQIKAESSMMGYLNAPSPFTSDGWFDTQDEVEADGEWIRIKGRRTDIINVGGRKVYPAEVESVILELPNIADVTVVREPHPITGNIVVAEVRLAAPEPIEEVLGRVRTHCFAKLPAYKVPVKVRLETPGRVSSREKKMRRDCDGKADPSGEAPSLAARPLEAGETGCVIRRAEPSDLGAIRELLSLRDGRPWTDEQVSWFFRGLDPSQSVAWLAWVGSRPVGLSMMFLRTLSGPNGLARTGYWANLFIDPRYRDRLLYPRLPFAMFEYARGAQLAFIYTLVRLRELAAAHVRLGFAPVGTVPVLMKPLRPGRLLAKYKGWSSAAEWSRPVDWVYQGISALRRPADPPGVNVEEISLDDGRVDRLVEMHRKASVGRIADSLSVQDFRYRYRQTRESTAYCLLGVCRRGGEPVAGLVYRMADRGEGIRVGVVMDVLTAPGEEDAVIPALVEAERRACASEGEVMLHVNGSGDATGKLIAQLGYRESPEVYQCLIWPKASLLANPELGKIRSWRLSFGDHDAF
jgi:acyl-coenzyme A synthetase/AMP-(fatty) acid ligase